MKNNFLILTFLIYGIFVTAQTKPIIEWTIIPAGTFTMGSPTSEVGRSKNETQHQVTLSAFMISKYEVTFEQYLGRLVYVVGVAGTTMPVVAGQHTATTLLQTTVTAL